MALPVNVREAGIWHEVGHIHYKHYFKMPIANQDELRKTRIGYINSGNVMPIEKEADEFAVKRIGKEAVIDFLGFLLETRPGGNMNSLNEMGRKELESRMQIITES